MSVSDIQIDFFQALKSKAAENISFVDDIAEVLHISADSAYRRIRGEKPLLFQEVCLLAEHYKISVDQFLHLNADNYIFSGKINDHVPETFDNYMNELEKNFLFFNKFSHRNMQMLIKDIPPFVHFQIPELAAFKCFLWCKSILHESEYQSVKFDPDDTRYHKYINQGKKIVELYLQIPNAEIWNIDSINSTLRQINFHYESGNFRDKQTAFILFEKVEKLIDHFQLQAETGKKFLINGERSDLSSSFMMYVNELILGDNSYLLELDDKRITFLNHSVLYFTHTTDKRFNDSMFTNIENLKRKSTLISGVGEKERQRFFNGLRNRIDQHKRLII